jgi:hypothetical protein
MARLDEEAALTVGVIEEQLREPDLLPLARARCQGMIEAIKGQVSDIKAILLPLVGGEDSEQAAAPPRAGLASPLKYIHYAYRDWGWPPGTERRERARAGVG